MKHFLIVLLVFCAIANTALGETIAQRVNAPEIVSLPAMVHDVKSSLAFDAKVIVPAVERVPILQVKIDEITEESILAAADALGLTDIDRSASAWNDDIFEDGGSTKGYTGSSGWHQFYAWNRYECEDDLEAVTFSKLYRNYFKKAEYFVGQLAARPYPNALREGSMTRDDALALAESTLQAFTQPYAFALQVDGALGGYARLTDVEIAALNAGKKKADAIPKYPYAFSFHFAPVFEGIPLTQYDTPGGWNSKEDVEALTEIGYSFSEPVDSRVQIVVLDAGVHALEWQNPMSVIATLQEDVELLPFPDILEKGMELLKQYCIDADDHYESEGSCSKITVTEIRFGYMCRQMEPGAMDLRLVPVWDFMVINDYSNDKSTWLNDHYGQAVVTLSAEDGRVVNR